MTDLALIFRNSFRDHYPAPSLSESIGLSRNHTVHLADARCGNAGLGSMGAVRNPRNRFDALAPKTVGSNSYREGTQG